MDTRTGRSPVGVVQNTRELPATYRLHARIDQKEDRSLARPIALIFASAVAAMAALAVLLDLPLAGWWSRGVTIPVTVAACVTYMVAHELTHGVVLWALTRVRPTFGVRLPYLVTGSPAYLTRTSALAVALAPAVLWGGVLVLMLLVVPDPVFLTVYVVTALHAASCAGDLVYAVVLARLPGPVLVQDSGDVTAVFLPTG